ncbi:uncharacterized protein [Nicotiana tomentosiformis]|uniref:Uncharacterized protein isoform X1 n=1 Tax=Nicotiana tabacum TaxID=4097 RepID=A0A1S3XK72_TOBAC|nr:PREDICTED: uncharacterized protein LOC107766109 isoform X1 [Nicotiana tabacum]XP_033508126.1 uncharacterized protein LOC104119023 isoform X1 [Nicotiana tomentosiformis]
MAFRLVGRQMAALLGAPTTQIRKQLAAGRVLLGAPRTQMRYAGGDGRYIVIVRGAKLTGRVGYERVENGGYCQQFSSGQGGDFHPEVQAFYNGIVFGGLPTLFWANWQMWKIDQSSNEVYTERSMEIEKILKELS